MVAGGIAGKECVMSSGENGLTDKQQRFIAFYLKNPNATNAARLAGYEGNEVTLGAVGYENLNKPQIQAEIARLRQARRLTPDAVLDMIESVATVDLTPYRNEEGLLDVDRLADAGLGYLVEGIKPGRNGLEVTLASPQEARKLLARHHRLVGANVEIDQSTTVEMSADMLQGLTEQIAAAAQQMPRTDDSDDA